MGQTFKTHKMLDWIDRKYICLFFLHIIAIVFGMITILYYFNMMI
jgi:hypothetical protein